MHSPLPPPRPWRPVTGRLAKREAARLGGKVYLLHTYSNGAVWMIIMDEHRIRATRIAPGGSVSDAGHVFRRLPGSGISSPAVPTEERMDDDHG